MTLHVDAAHTSPGPPFGFWLQEPDGRAAPGARGSRDDGLAPIASRLMRVLIVDDEQIIADTLTSILNLSGFQARAVYSGEQALEAVPEFCPDIVLSDVRMPGRNGIDTGREIHNRCPQARIVLFSGQAGTAGLIEKARREGYGFELWSKPLHPKELVRRLREL